MDGGDLRETIGIELVRCYRLDHGEIPLFAVRHVLGVRFDGSTPVLKPLLYPGTGPLMADLRFRNGRLKLDIPVPAVHFRRG